MITSQRTFGLLGAASFLVAGMFFQLPQGFAAEKQSRYAEERISVQHARVAKSRQATPTKKRQSMVAQAASGRIPANPAEAPLAGSLANGKVRQVGFLNTHGRSCGPVCDCGNCGVEPVCGIDGVIGDPGCGIEVGCGIGAAISRHGHGCGPSCGGCDQCLGGGCGVEEIYVEGPGCGIETHGDCSCDACSSHGAGCVPICLPFLRVEWCRFEFFAGVQGYKGPLNFPNSVGGNSNVRDGGGSFGFFQGFNEGRSLRGLCGWDMAAQLGLRATQSNLSGAGFTDESRQQVFVTLGLFRKVDYGLQYGLVVDYLNDDWYFQGDSTQLRGELSWRHTGCHVCGFQFMAGLDDHTSSTLVTDTSGNPIVSSITFEPTDQYRLFYRRLLGQGGTYNAFAGWTDRDDGLLGADLTLPLRRCLALSTGATYLIPKQGKSSGGFAEEGWNISLGLVYRPGGPSGCGRYCRPMFDVADNGTFMFDRK